MYDLVSREAVKKWLERWVGYIDMDIIRRMQYRVIDIPPTQTERKKAKWIDGHCSNCGCDIPAYIIDWKWQKDMDAKFCPNCGARMVKEGEEHD